MARLKLFADHPATGPFFKELSYAMVIFNKHDIHAFVKKHTEICAEKGHPFDLIEFLLHRPEVVRKHVRITRPEPNVLLKRVMSVYLKHHDAKDSKGIALFSEDNKEQWKDFITHVKKFVEIANLQWMCIGYSWRHNASISWNREWPSRVFS